MLLEGWHGVLRRATDLTSQQPARSRSHSLDRDFQVSDIKDLGGLLKKWDQLSRAIGAMQVAQPAQMTAASDRLEAAKSAFEAELYSVATGDLEPRAKER